MIPRIASTSCNFLSTACKYLEQQGLKEDQKTWCMLTLWVDLVYEPALDSASLGNVHNFNAIHTTVFAD